MDVFSNDGNMKNKSEWLLVEEKKTVFFARSFQESEQTLICIRSHYDLINLFVSTTLKKMTD